MGDIADMLLDNFDEADEWYEDDDLNCYSKPPPSCNKCGMQNLMWGKVAGRSVLYEDIGKLHYCKKSSLPIEVLSEHGKTLFKQLREKKRQTNFEIVCKRRKIAGFIKRLSVRELLDLVEDLSSRARQSEPDIGDLPLSYYEEKLKNVRNELEKRMLHQSH